MSEGDVMDGARLVHAVDELARSLADAGFHVVETARYTALVAEVCSLRERVATLEDERSEAAHQYRDAWIAERERRTELERGIRDYVEACDVLVSGDDVEDSWISASNRYDDLRALLDGGAS